MSESDIKTKESDPFPDLVGDASFVRTIIERDESEQDNFQQSLRPTVFEDYVGQKRVCESLEISIGAAKKRSEPLDHVLLHGPPGLGKTTLAAVIAQEMSSKLKATSGPVIEKPGDLAAILANLAEGDVLFIDEIHRLPRAVEEILYPALEDFNIDILIGQGAAARSVKLAVKPFTLVGATTRTGLLTAPLRSRFGIVERMEFYSFAELEKIVIRSAGILEIEIDQQGAAILARRSRGTPRIVNRLLKRARDFAQQRADSIITEKVARDALSLLEIDERGLDRMDKTILSTIINKFSGGPVGLDTLAAALHEDKGTLEDVYEPYLLQEGFLMRTPRGRVATEAAVTYLSGSKNSNSAAVNSAAVNSTSVKSDLDK
ncbi:UNVERIFIED_CONTAM: hypothetical protein GTU68_049652 [Idotea baltica]|nr:hypothetical protein [Idotea baltica]